MTISSERRQVDGLQINLNLTRLSSDPQGLTRRLRTLSIQEEDGFIDQLCESLVEVESLVENHFKKLVEELLITSTSIQHTDSTLLESCIEFLIEKHHRMYDDHLCHLLSSISSNLDSHLHLNQLQPLVKKTGRHGRPHVFTKHQTTVLYELLHHDDKLTLNEKMFVAERLGLTKDQVNRWVSQFSIIIHFYPMILSASELIDARLSVPIMLLLVSFVTPERVDWVRNAKQPSTPRS